MDDLIDATLELEHILNVPPITARETLDLAYELLDTTPKSTDAALAHAALTLRSEARALELTLEQLGEAHDPRDEQREVAIESLTEHLWTGLMTSLHGWSVFLLPGTEALMRAGDDGEVFDDTQAKAHRALTLCKALFPPEDKGFLIRPPFHRQTQTLEAFVRLAESEDWPDAQEIVGKALWPLIPLMQSEHQRFVSTGRWRTREGPQLMAQRARLRRAIGRYNNRVILTFLDPDVVATHVLLTRTFAPIDRLRERLKLFRPPLDVEKALRAAVYADAVFAELDSP